MIDTDTITVYWSPATYLLDQKESWSQLYAEPQSLFKQLRDKQHKDSGFNNLFACPATKPILEKTFVVSVNHGSTVELPTDYLQTIAYTDSKDEIINVTGNRPLIVKKARASSLTGYSNLVYNMQWLFFADEPLIMRQTPPYMPPHSVGEGVILASGEYDIGQWFRALNLDYHVPFTTSTLTFASGDPLMYLEFKTSKKIIFKRFNVNQPLFALAVESASSATRYSPFKSLNERYAIAKRSLLREQVLFEIKKSLIE